MYVLVGACGGQQWVASAGAVEYGCQRPNSCSLQEASVLNYSGISPAPGAVSVEKTRLRHGLSPSLCDAV